jgi:hypothetical protein
VTAREQALEAALRQVRAILDQPVQSGPHGSNGTAAAILRGDCLAARNAIDAALASRAGKGGVK